MKTNNDHGFTLIEVLVALTIFSVIGLSTFSLLNRVIMARTAVERAEEQLAQTRQALAQLSEDLSSAQISALLPIEGNSDSLVFASLVKLPNGGSALRRIAYVLRPENRGEAGQLIRVVSDFHGHREETPLLSEVMALHWQYLRSANLAAPWAEAWTSVVSMPRAVRVQIDFSSTQEVVNLICPIRSYYGKTTKK